MRSLASVVLIGACLTAGANTGHTGTLDKAKLQAQRLTVQEANYRPAKVPVTARKEGMAGRVAALQSLAKAASDRAAARPPDKVRLGRLAAALSSDADSNPRLTTVNKAWVDRSTPALPPISERK